METTFNPDKAIDHVPAAAAVSRLTDCAMAHRDKEAFIEASGLLDMSAALLLRGISFLSECLEICRDDSPEMQVKIAQSTIQEVTALCAALLDMQNMANGYRQLQRMEAGKP